MSIVTSETARWVAVLGAPFVLAAVIVLYQLGTRSEPSRTRAQQVAFNVDANAATLQQPAADAIAVQPFPAEAIAESISKEDELLSQQLVELTSDSDPETRDEAEVLLGLVREEAATN